MACFFLGLADLVGRVDYQARGFHELLKREYWGRRGVNEIGGITSIHEIADGLQGGGQSFSEIVGIVQRSMWLVHGLELPQHPSAMSDMMSNSIQDTSMPNSFRRSVANTSLLLQL
jgi:hypothetical protein